MSRRDPVKPRRVRSEIRRTECPNCEPFAAQRDALLKAARDVVADWEHCGSPALGGVIGKVHLRTLAAALRLAEARDNRERCEEDGYLKDSDGCPHYDARGRWIATEARR